MVNEPRCVCVCVCVCVCLQDPRYIVTYYHNPLTGASTYDKPPEYAEWEKQYDAYLSKTVH